MVLPHFERILSFVIAHLPQSKAESEAGDVPGWVLVTLMTAGLVTMIWALADQALRDWFQQAITSVVHP
ncbi:hypothetical protein HMPREF0044_0777 [Gleimia coleocanis DSM 15436]|uniref:Uncharacterized protein n=1 Tax=Gleimia coleocanis DSM 15436 TaxID=525245 RepID=C0VZP9_9ACTO|nr:hypothetical protein [Gleimia coleocanis]EEH63758.1 hypothetical protein HMPREF0044_0777 [Gleimia coleocanis DSM 15436]